MRHGFQVIQASDQFKFDDLKGNALTFEERLKRTHACSGARILLQKELIVYVRAIYQILGRTALTISNSSPQW